MNNTYFCLLKFASKFIQLSNSPSKDNPTPQLEPQKKTQTLGDEVKPVAVTVKQKEISPRPSSVPPKMEEKTIIKPSITIPIIPELKLPPKPASRPTSATKSKTYLPQKSIRPSTATNTKNTNNMEPKTPKGTTFYEKLLRSQNKSMSSTAPASTTHIEHKNNQSITMVTISPTKQSSSNNLNTSSTPDKIVVPDTVDDHQIRQLKKLALKKQIEDMRNKKKT